MGSGLPIPINPTVWEMGDLALGPVLIGNGASFVGVDSNIAKLEGCDLILREDYFDKLKKIVPNVVYYTEVL
jgi:hypothetical protein